MKASAIIAAFVAVLGLGGVAHAGKTIASPSIFAATTQDQAGCFIGNFGSSPVGIDVHIYDESGNSLNAGNSCGGVVDAGFICSVFVPIGFGQAYSCAATAAGSTKRLRGSFIIFDAGAPLRATDLY